MTLPGNLGRRWITENKVVESLELDAGITGVGIDGTVLELVSRVRKLHPCQRDQHKPGGSP